MTCVVQPLMVEDETAMQGRLKASMRWLDVRDAREFEESVYREGLTMTTQACSELAGSAR